MSAISPHLAFPFSVGPNGRALASVNLADQVQQELMQLVLTDPGERLFLAAFGGGARRLLFQGIDATTAAIAQSTLTQAIQNWMGNRATLQGVQVTAEGETLNIAITYQVAGVAGSVKAVFQSDLL
jgi:uncharacterized protein